MAKKTDYYRALYLEARELIVKMKERNFHEPDSDMHEYCRDCGRSPYNVPPHSEKCLVPKVAAFLNKTL